MLLTIAHIDIVVSVRVQDIVAKWEIVRRHDTDGDRKAALTSEILDQAGAHKLCTTVFYFRS